MTTSIPGANGSVSPGSDNGSVSSITTEADVSRRTLETYPERALAMLRTLGTDNGIRATMLSYGYSDAEHKEGWRRLHAASGFTNIAEPSTEMDASVRSAIAELDAMDERIFRITSATLSKRFPAQAQFVLGGIGASRGAAAVINLQLLMDRLDALENDPSRVATRDQDREAVAKLGERGLSKSERSRIRQLIEASQRANPVDLSPSAREEADKQYVANLVALRDWYQEWAEIARALITRRDHLIRLGLASQKRGDTEAPETPAAPVAPVDSGV